MTSGTGPGDWMCKTKKGRDNARALSLSAERHAKDPFPSSFGRLFGNSEGEQRDSERECELGIKEEPIVRPESRRLHASIAKSWLCRGSGTDTRATKERDEKEKCQRRAPVGRRGHLPVSRRWTHPGHDSPDDEIVVDGLQQSTVIARGHLYVAEC